MSQDVKPEALTETDEYRYRAILVAIRGSETDEITSEESLDELERLLHTDDSIACGRVIQNLDTAHPTHYVGKGKAEDVRLLVEQTGANCVIFDDEISARQQSTLDEFFGENVTVLDRTALILEIFA